MFFFPSQLLVIVSFATPSYLEMSKLEKLTVVVLSVYLGTYLIRKIFFFRFRLSFFQSDFAQPFLFLRHRLTLGTHPWTALCGAITIFIAISLNCILQPPLTPTLRFLPGWSTYGTWSGGGGIEREVVSSETLKMLTASLPPLRHIDAEQFAYAVPVEAMALQRNLTIVIHSDIHLFNSTT